MGVSIPLPTESFFERQAAAVKTNQLSGFLLLLVSEPVIWPRVIGTCLWLTSGKEDYTLAGPIELFLVKHCSRKFSVK